MRMTPVVAARHRPLTIYEHGTNLITGRIMMPKTVLSVGVTMWGNDLFHRIAQLYQVQQVLADGPNLALRYVLAPVSTNPDAIPCILHSDPVRLTAMDTLETELGSPVISLIAGGGPERFACHDHPATMALGSRRSYILTPPEAPGESHGIAEVAGGMYNAFWSIDAPLLLPAPESMTNPRRPQRYQYLRLESSTTGAVSRPMKVAELMCRVPDTSPLPDELVCPISLADLTRNNDPPVYLVPNLMNGRITALYRRDAIEAMPVRRSPLTRRPFTLDNVQSTLLPGWR